MNSLETLVDQITTPENKQRLTAFFSVVNDILKKPQQVVITEDDESKLVVLQTNGSLVFNVTSGFVKALGNHTLTVCGAINDNTVYQPPEPEKPFVPGEQDYTRLLANGYILFLKSDEKYIAKYSNSALEQISDISIINYIKRNNLDETIFQMVKASLSKFHVVGDPWPEKERVSPDGVKIVYVDRPIITEKIVEVQKVVLKEVPIYVDKVVIKEVFVDKKESPKEEEQSTKSQDEDESESDEEDEDQDDESSESSEQEESEESEEPEPEPTKSLKIKGKYLNAQKTIAKSGDYVYRIVKKSSGQSQLAALGRWDPEIQPVNGAKWPKLLSSDIKKITELGHTIAKKPE